MSAAASGVGFDNWSLIENLTTWTTTGVENADDDEAGEEYSLIENIIVDIVLAILVLVAFGGNLLVSVVIFTDPRLKSRDSNLFLISLAFTDMLVASLIMSFALINRIFGRWEFGTKFCLIWVSFDITCSTASILTLCLICIDRYMQIARPLHYQTFMTKTQINFQIVMAWLIAVILAFLPLQLGWHLPPPDQRLPIDPHVCILDISFVYAVVSSSISFYIPCIVILILYFRIFLLTRAHVKHMSENDVELQIYTAENVVENVSIQVGTTPSMVRTVFTLGIIVGVFLVCWLPFFIVNPIFAKCATCIPPLMFSVFTWMGWANSCANPFIYSLMNREFQNAFLYKIFRKREPPSSTFNSTINNMKVFCPANTISTFDSNVHDNSAGNTLKPLSMQEQEAQNEEPDTVLGMSVDKDDLTSTLPIAVENTEMNQNPTVSCFAQNSHNNNADNTLKPLYMQEKEAKNEEPDTVLLMSVDKDDLTPTLQSAVQNTKMRIQQCPVSHIDVRHEGTANTLSQEHTLNKEKQL